ncbi:glycoside hydrolase family 6 protein, partial [Streptomyces sp. TRM76130]|nr:glycoside hydrolase family 6 protein [Streptomyces sp. TRM76130]
MFRLIRVLAPLTALGLAAGCSSTADVDEASVAGAPSRRTAGAEFWVDPDSPAVRQGRLWRRQGRSDDAELLQRIAGQPAALWPAGEIDPAPLVRRATRAATKAGRTVLLTAYNIPHRDCGQHSAGGAPDAAAYRRWIGRFAAAIGDARALVVLEPDAVAHVVDGCTPGELHAERERLLGEAVTRLKQQPHTKVYLDAGNPSWIKDPRALVDPLKRAGVEGADGFALNVSNFQTTEDTTAYGKELSRELGGK